VFFWQLVGKSFLTEVSKNSGFSDRCCAKLEAPYCAEASVFNYPGDLRVRGLASLCSADANESLLFVPNHAILSDTSVDQRVIDVVAEDMGTSPHNPAVARDLAIAAGLLRERAAGRRSAFAAYLSSIPNQQQLPDNLPRWDDMQLGVLSAVMWDVTIWRKLILQSLQSIVVAEPSLFGSAEESDCIWALAILVSRQVHGQLIPLIDQANHAAEPNAQLGCNRSGCSLVALKRVSPGDELTISYGHKPNLHLLQAYGFAMPDNKVSSLSLNFSSLPGINDKCGASRVKLHHSADLAISSEATACLEAAVGQCAFLRALLQECEALNRRLAPPADGPMSYHAQALGKPNAQAALQALEDRTPKMPLDVVLLKTVRQEMETAARCVTDARGKLKRLETEYLC